MEKEILNYLNTQKENFIKDLKALVEIPSIRSETAEGMPFGKPCFDVLKAGKEIIEDNGFSVSEFSGYAIETDLGDNPCLMLLAHLDVVPVGDDWTRCPFDLTIDGDTLYGRGTTDDKGPALACLYAMKAVKHLYGEPKSGVRLVLGAGEETGSEDMEYYFSERPVLKYTLSPDADYPLINIEKGRYAPVFSKFTGSDSFIVSIKGGDTANIVPGKAQAVIRNYPAELVEEAISEVEKETGCVYTVSNKEGLVTIVCEGKNAHAASPEKGVNSNTGLIKALVSVDKNKIDPVVSALHFLLNTFPHNDVNGKAAGISLRDEESGDLTLNMGILSYCNGRLSCGLDLRLPICATKENVCDVLYNLVTDAGFSFDYNPGLKPVHYVSSDSPLVRETLSVYEAYTGLKGECLAIGGGTYVHNIEGGIAFGPEFSGKDYRIHGADEFASLNELLLTSAMYAQIIKDIAY